MAEPVSYDLFVSYANGDRAWVEGYLLDALVQAGVRCLTPADFPVGGALMDEYGRAVRQSRRTLLVLSEAYLASDVVRFGDLLAQDFGLETSTWSVIPLLLQRVALPPRLAILTPLDATNPDDWPGVVERLCAILQRPLPAASSPARPLCPYPGMVPFGEADRARFFGREEEIRAAVEALRLNPFLAVVGPSGSGKSSLVAAGLVPALRTSSLFGGSAWQICEVRPGEAPLDGLAAALGGDPLDPVSAVAARLGSESADQRLLLAVDQFEEVYTVAQRDAGAFQEALLGLAAVPPCCVVLTARADFYPELMASPLWSEIRQNRLEVAPLDETGLRQAILGPAATAGVYVEAALVERLVADSAGEPGVLPLVQETLVLLWERMERRFLPLRAYEALVLPRHAYGGQAHGVPRTGLQVAMARRADAAFAALSPSQQAIARRVFLRLVQFGEGRADTRRRQPVAALRAAGDDPRQFDVTLNHLADRRLLTMSGGNGSPHADLAHEALIEGWPQLQQWLTERREAEQTRRRLEAKAEEWVRLGRESGGLLDAAELPEAERWLSGADAAELGYGEDLPVLVEASRTALVAAEAEREAAREREVAQAQALAAEQQRRADAQARSTRRLRVLAASLGVALLLSVAAVVIALDQRREADDQRQDAVAQRQDADAQRQLAEARQAESDRLRLVSVAQALAAQAPRELESGQYERGALLARQAHLFNAEANGGVWSQVDESLRTVLGSPYSSRILSGHESGLTDVDFFPDGQTLASSSWDGTVRLWDLRQPIAPPVVMSVHEDGAMAMALSPDGMVLAAGDGTGAVRLWNPHLPKSSPIVLRNNLGSVAALAFAPNGQTLASADLDGTALLWDLQQNVPTSTILLSPQVGVFFDLAFSPDGRLLAAGGGKKPSAEMPLKSYEGIVLIWDLTQRGSEPIRLSGHESAVQGLAFSPDGRTLASAGVDGTVRLWQVDRLDAAPTILGEEGMILASVAFSPDGRTLVAGASSGLVWMWDLGRPDVPPVALLGHEEEVTRIDFSPDGLILVTASMDDTLRLWDLRAPAAEPIAFIGGDGNVVSAILNVDGQSLTAASSRGVVQRWDLRRPDAEPIILTDPRETNVVVLSPDGQTLAVAGIYGGGVSLVDLRRSDAAPVALAELPEDRQKTADFHEAVMILALRFSPDGRLLAGIRFDQSLAQPEHTVLVWDVTQPNRTPANVRLPPEGITDGDYIFGSGRIFAVAFSPDGRTLAGGTGVGAIWRWDLSESSRPAVAWSPLTVGTPRPTDHMMSGLPEEGISRLEFSPDGRYLAAARFGGAVSLFDANDPSAAPILLAGHEKQVDALAFGSDGQVLATGGADGTVRLWDLRRPFEAPIILRQHANRISVVAFSPDDATLMTAGFDGVQAALRIWIVPTEQLADLVCQTVWRNLTAEEWNLFVGADLAYRTTCSNLPPGNGATAPTPAATPT